MEMMTILAAIIAVSTILYGVRALKKKQTGSVQTAILASMSVFSLAIIGMFVFMFMGSPVMADQATTAAVVSSGISLGEGFKYIAASNFSRSDIL